MFKKMILGLALVASANAMANTPALNSNATNSSTTTAGSTKAEVVLNATVLASRTITASGDTNFGEIDETKENKKEITLKLQGNKSALIEMEAKGYMLKVGALATGESYADTDKVPYNLAFAHVGNVTISTPKVEGSFSNFETSGTIATVSGNTNGKESDDSITCTVTVPTFNGKSEGQYTDTITFTVATK